jgi:hypothetical protein
MFGFSALFGRSRDVQRLDAALRSAGLHPVLVPDAVKIAALKFLKETGHDEGAALLDSGEVAEMLAYCMLGDQSFRAANGPSAGQALERRLQAALDVDDSLDARLVLLTLHAGVIEPTLQARYDLRTGDP